MRLTLPMRNATDHRSVAHCFATVLKIIEPEGKSQRLDHIWLCLVHSSSWHQVPSCHLLALRAQRLVGQLLEPLFLNHFQQRLSSFEFVHQVRVCQSRLRVAQPQAWQPLAFPQEPRQLVLVPEPFSLPVKLAADTRRSPERGSAELAKQAAVSADTCRPSNRVPDGDSPGSSHDISGCPTKYDWRHG